MPEGPTFRGPRGRLHAPTWSKGCWRGRPSEACWLCRLRLLGQVFLEDDDDEGDACPGCGETVVEGEAPDGYDDVHCGRCVREIEQRQDWITNDSTATTIGGTN